MHGADLDRFEALFALDEFRQDDELFATGHEFSLDQNFSALTMDSAGECRDYSPEGWGSGGDGDGWFGDAVAAGLLAVWLAVNLPSEALGVPFFGLLQEGCHLAAHGEVDQAVVTMESFVALGVSTLRLGRM